MTGTSVLIPYTWVKRHCINSSISMEEYFDMMKAIQAAVLPFGIFTLAFCCHMLHEDKVKSRYNTNEICFSPLLFDTDDIPAGVSTSDYFYKIPAQKLSGNEEPEVYHQMNISVDNIFQKQTWTGDVCW